MICLSLSLFLTLSAWGCADQFAAGDVFEPTSSLEILSIESAEPVLLGSQIRLTLRGTNPLESERSLVLEESQRSLTVTLGDWELDGSGGVLFSMTPEALEVLGSGRVVVWCSYREGAEVSEPAEFSFELAESLAVQLSRVSGGSVYRNEELILHGEGFTTQREGVLTAEISGHYETDLGERVSILTSIPIAPVERFDRSRGSLRLSTAIGGVRPGTFSGEIRLHSHLSSGRESSSEVHAVVWEFLPPAVFSVVPEVAYLGQIVSVVGAGFVGLEDEPEAVTVLRFVGSFSGRDGALQGFGPKEIVVLTSSGELGSFAIEVEVGHSELSSAFWGDLRGTFVGRITPVTILGTEEVVGETLQVQFSLAGVKQIVVVRFLPGFYEALRFFGLSVAAEQVVEASIERMENIWSDYNLFFQLDEPHDFLPSAYATLEIGGPDPNGLGLMGYENTQGKDVGNLRLFDQIGGENAATQADGFPGFGGVFIESYLYWSQHPPFEGPRPFGSPHPDPLFDEIFDSVRTQPASLEEIRGIGEAGRVEAVREAIRALGAIIGETAAHEVGHSVGLAQPYQPAGHYHSLVPGPGCLMDSGADRPLGERAARDGYPESQFCSDEPGYLQKILPLPAAGL